MAVPKSILSFSDIFSTSHFTKIGIINFLINYKDMCENYNIKKKSVFVVILGIILNI
jgi:hypothetical protein